MIYLSRKILSLIGVLVIFFLAVLTLPKINLLTALSGTVSGSHPFGRQVYGHLFWELDSEFLQLTEELNLTERLAAFQTTLPDPLPGEEYNVSHAAELLAGTVVEAGQIFSMNSTIGPYTMERGFQEGPTYRGSQVITTTGGGVCKIASTLYNVAVLADLKIVERYPHGMLVPYVPAGQDATVAYGSRDLKFQNNTGSPLLIWAETKENTLYMAFYGQVKPPEVIWHHEVLNRQKPQIIYRINKSLQPGSEKIILPGEEGMTVKSWLTVRYADGKEVTKKIGIDYYRPMPGIVERSTR